MMDRKPKPHKEERANENSDVFAEPRYVSVFHCSRRNTLHAATLDRKGRNLPKDLCAGGAWTLIGQLVVGPDQSMHPEFDIKVLKIGIEQNGFYLWSTETEPPPDTLRLMR
jgi:hypothetical protein